MRTIPTLLLVLTMCPAVTCRGQDVLDYLQQRRAVQALDDIGFELFRLNTSLSTSRSLADLPSYSFGSPFMGTYPVGTQMNVWTVYPTRSQWKHYYRMQRAQAKRDAYRERVEARKAGLK